MSTVLHALGNALLLNLQPTAARTTSASGTAVDLQDYHGTGALVLDAAAGTGTTPTNDITFEESDDNSTFTAVPAGAFYGGANYTQLVTTASRQVLYFNVAERKRYLREKHVVAGTTPSYTYSVNFLGQKQYS